jgi:hypothetical protein
MEFPFRSFFNLSFPELRQTNFLILRLENEMFSAR